MLFAQMEVELKKQTVCPDFVRLFLQTGRYRYLLFVTLLFVFIFSGCQNTTNTTPGTNYSDKTAIVKQNTNYDITMIGVVKEVDVQFQTIIIYDTNTKLDVTLNYTGASDVLSKNGAALSMAQITKGEIVDAFYDSYSNKLVKMQISKEAWEYKGVNNLQIDGNEHRMDISGRKYLYEEDIIVNSGEEELRLMEINNKDELTVKGIGEKIVSIIVTKGHGYIRLTGYDGFVGGYLELGHDIFMTVSKNMFLVAREGEYHLTLQNGELKGSKYVRVIKNQEITVDMSEFKAEPSRMTTVQFIITPQDAELYINGVKKSYARPMKLNFGNYNITIKASGYEDYTGILTVTKTQKEYEKVYIDLAEKESQSEESDISKSASATPQVTQKSSGGTSVSDNSSTVTPTPTPVKTASPKDEDHIITIQGPSGAEVYVDGIYKGLAPVSFLKQIGNLTITLAKTGYYAKSYSVIVTDNSEDVEFEFPELLAINNE